MPFGEDGFHTLSPTVNALYITYHGFFHFLIEGITLRHLLRLGFVCREGAERNRLELFLQGLRQSGFLPVCGYHECHSRGCVGRLSDESGGVQLTGRCTDRVLAMCWQISGMSADCPFTRDGRSWFATCFRHAGNTDNSTAAVFSGRWRDRCSVSCSMLRRN